MCTGKNRGNTGIDIIGSTLYLPTRVRLQLRVFGGLSKDRGRPVSGSRIDTIPFSTVILVVSPILEAANGKSLDSAATPACAPALLRFWLFLLAAGLHTRVLGSNGADRWLGTLPSLLNWWFRKNLTRYCLSGSNPEIGFDNFPFHCITNRILTRGMPMISRCAGLRS